MTTDVCRLCGKGRDEHHDFEPQAKPAGCVCDPLEWRSEIEPVCAAFAGDAAQNCDTCEHPKECHQ